MKQYLEKERGALAFWMGYCTRARAEISYRRMNLSKMERGFGGESPGNVLVE